VTQPVRVIVTNRPWPIRELVVEAIVEEQDIEILAEIQNELENSGIVDGKRPDFPIFAPEDSNNRPGICHVLLQRFPGMKILALAPDRNSSIFDWASFNIHSSQVEASEAGILNTLSGKGQFVRG
jgi:hypothetical protein